jgi:hypothetical protein
METRKTTDQVLAERITCPSYEAPRIEVVMTAEDLEREAMLAAIGGSGGGN